MGNQPVEPRHHPTRQRFAEWARRSWERSRPELVILAIYVVLTIVMTYPVAFKLSTHIAGHADDGFEHLWTLWWGKTAMWDLRTSMANLSYFYHPWGIYHPLLSMTPMIQITAIPLGLLFNPLITYNLVFLSSYVLTAFTTYLLCYQITKSRWAAFVGGLIYGFAPTRMIHGFGHLGQITVYWFPLYALFALRLIERPNWKNGLWTGVFMGISALVNFVHTAHFVFVFTLYWLLHLFFARRKLALSPQFLKPAALAFGVAAALTLPFAMPFLVNEITETVHYIMPGGATAGSTNPFSFITPSPQHPLRNRLTKPSPTVRRSDSAR